MASETYTLRIKYTEPIGAASSSDRVYLSTWKWQPSRSAIYDVIRRLRADKGSIYITKVQVIKHEVIDEFTP